MRRLRFILVPIALVAVAVLLLVGLPHPAAARGQGGSILIWPVAPVIAADKRAAALWLENPGSAPVTLQIRIYAWAQVDAKNIYAPQDIILGTPPIVTIAPGGKQLIRLTRTIETPAGTEAAYRVIVDEIPAARSPADAGATVSFRMRYSLPLFVYGQGLVAPVTASHSPPPPRESRPAQAKEGGRLSPSGPPEPGPALDWQTGADSEGRFIEVRNRGPIHARLTDVGFTSTEGNGSAATAPPSLARGLFGYILPGATMRWPLAADARAPMPGAPGTLLGAINGGELTVIERRAE